MDLSTFILAVFCLTNDWLKEKRLRQRGPSPSSEVLTIDIVGEYRGIHTEKDLYAYFKHHYGE